MSTHFMDDPLTAKVTQSHLIKPDLIHCIWQDCLATLNLENIVCCELIKPFKKAGNGQKNNKSEKKMLSFSMSGNSAFWQLVTLISQAASCCQLLLYMARQKYGTSGNFHCS